MTEKEYREAQEYWTAWFGASYIVAGWWLEKSLEETTNPSPLKPPEGHPVYEGIPSTTKKEFIWT